MVGRRGVLWVAVTATSVAVEGLVHSSGTASWQHHHYYKQVYSPDSERGRSSRRRKGGGICRRVVRREAKTGGGGYFKVVSDANRTVDYFGQSTWCDLVADGEVEVEETEPLLAKEFHHDGRDEPAWEERIFCTRTMNLGACKVIGYDMDYTLVHYQWERWEAEAYACTKEVLEGYGFPVRGLKFDDPDLVCRGLVIDKEKGNFLKIDRHGFVRRAMHGERRLDEAEIDTLYGRVLIDLREKSRYTFLNTLFSVSEGVLYSQLVTKLDSGALFREARPPFDASMCQTYADLYRAVAKALSKTHTAQTSKLKAAVAKNPAHYATREPKKLRATLADQRRAGKKLALITNSGWEYSDVMMRFVLDDPDWRRHFDVVFVSARKPSFFTTELLPCYELVVVNPEVPTAEGHSASSAPGGGGGAFDAQQDTEKTYQQQPRRPALLRETERAAEGGVFCGGSARFLEKLFRVAADEVLYVGDHVFVDANAVKASMRWRTALVVQELEAEIAAYRRERDDRARIDALLVRKEALGRRLNDLRCWLRRYEERAHDFDVGTPHNGKAERDAFSADLCRRRMVTLIKAIADLDHQLFPAIRYSGRTFNRYWGFISRAGYNDKSHIQRQMEKYADIYTSKVTNFLAYTPYHYFRSSPQRLAHDLPPLDREPPPRGRATRFPPRPDLLDDDDLFLSAAD